MIHLAVSIYYLHVFCYNNHGIQAQYTISVQAVDWKQ